MRTLDEIGLTAGAGGDKASDRHNYLNRYEPFFEPLRERPVRLLEIGIEKGFSAWIWLEYFYNEHTKVYGVDLLPAPDIKDWRYHHMQGDQTVKEFWNVFLGGKNEPFDIIIDDGSHKTSGIEMSFKMLFPYVAPHGYYIIEDLSTAYMAGYSEPGYSNQMWFIFNLIHDMNSQLAYRPPHWEPLIFPIDVNSSYGIDWIQLSEELAIIKKK